MRNNIRIKKVIGMDNERIIFEDELGVVYVALWGDFRNWGDMNLECEKLSFYTTSSDY